MATAEGSDRYPGGGDCGLCQDTGTISWQQPTPAGVLRTIEMPCPNGCGGHWKQPYAEGGRVVDQSGDRPTRVRGRADEANRIGADFIAGALRKWGAEHPEQHGS